MKKSALPLIMLLLLIIAGAFILSQQATDTGTDLTIITKGIGGAGVVRTTHLRCTAKSNTNPLCGQLGGLKDGNYRCPNLNASAITVEISGKLRGDDIVSLYSFGPCQSGLEAWRSASPAWQPVLQPSVAATLIVLPDRSTRVSPSLARRILSLPKTLVSDDCLTAMPKNPFRNCRINLQGDSSAVAITASPEQLNQLVGAGLGEIKQFLRKAKRVPVPQGYPGYDPGEKVSPHLPPLVDD